MLAALCENGLNATGFDIRDPKSYTDLAAPITNDPAEIPKDTNVLISVVRDIPQTESLLFTHSKVLDTLPNLRYLVISSTLSPKYLADLAERVPCTLIDAPMSGAAIKAQQAQLSFMIGGAETDIFNLMPAFRAMGTHFHHMGSNGTGMSAKVLNNILAAANTVMTRMVLDWADKSEIDEEKLLALINTSSGQNWFASGFDSIEFSRDGYTDDNTIGILKKDVESAIDAAPPGADTTLPETLIQHIANLSPRLAKN